MFFKKCAATVKYCWMEFCFVSIINYILYFEVKVVYFKCHVCLLFEGIERANEFESARAIHK